MPAKYLAPCSRKVADPLTTGDQYDLARALAQAAQSVKVCADKNDALIDAVDVRDQVTQSLINQINKSK